jgi:hypothetical protein
MSGGGRHGGFGFEICESEARARDAVKNVGGAIEIVL